MTTAAQLRRWAEEYDDTPAEAWKPVPGDVLVGQVLALELREVQPRPGDTRPRPPVLVVTLKDEDGTVRAFWCWHKVAAAEMAKARPEVGDTLAIRRLADEQGGEYKYARYVVFTDQPKAKGVDWDQVETEEEGNGVSAKDLLLPREEPKGFAKELDESAALDDDLAF